MSSRKTFHQFDTAHEAQDYRKSEGCGGWIFVSQATGEATIFPVCMTPRDVLWHPLAEGTGKLIGAEGQVVAEFEA